MVINATITAPSATAYAKTSEFKKLPSPTTFLFFIVVYKFAERVTESFGHFYTKTR
jgi:hypothetical protein